VIVPPILCKRFVGRGAELEYLAERRREAGRSRGGIVLVRGEAGVGKSRLLAEFAGSLARSRWRVGTGRCLEFAQRPYGPVLEVLARFEPAAATLAPALSTREQLDALVGAFTRAAERSAIVTIVEDVHWADAATVELLSYLATRIGTMRMLAIVSMRPEETHPDHPLYALLAKLEATPTAARIVLPPLTDGERAVFIDDALTGLDVAADVRRYAASTGEGNPFFTEELLKSAVERAASGQTAAYRTLPTTLRATLTERLRPLPEAERRVLTQAAVIGRSFDVATLAATLGDGHDAIVAALRHARRLQLIEEDGTQTFRFRHALVREAIYDDFLSVQLRPMHRTIAEVLERADPASRPVESLAYHWWAAGDRERAARYNEEAGDAAAAVHAHGDAITFYGRAADALAPDSTARAALLEKIAHRHLLLGNTESANGSLAAAGDIYAGAAEHEREASCRVQQAIGAYTVGAPNPTAPLEAMLARLDPDDHRTRSRVHLGIAWLTASFYHPAIAGAHVDAVDPRVIAEAPDVRLRVHNIRAWIAMTLADVEGFRPQLAAWIEAARAVEQPGLLTSAHFNGAFCCTVLGLHEEARENAERAVALARRERNVRGEAGALAVAACAALHRGDLGAARAALEPLGALNVDDSISLAHAAAWGSLTAAHTGDERLIGLWFDRLESTVSPLAIALCGAGFAEILVRRGRLADAGALLARRIGGLGDLARGIALTLLAVGRYGTRDDVPNARRGLAAVAALPRETPERYALPLFDAYVAARDGDPATARALASRAAGGFHRLRLPLLEAAAREVAGERDAAFAIYERCGATDNAARLRPAASSSERIAAGRGDVLSEREREIATLVASGRSNLEIARALAISHKTVEKHLGSVYRKLGFSTRAQLGAYVFSSRRLSDTG
jgi:DNA-binding NarL/FixJ family response regulator